MKAMTYVAAGALALVPMLALAGEQTAKPDMQPLRVSFDGRTVPVKATTTVDYTAAGPVKVRTWAWNDPKDGASFEIQTSGWHETPSAALKQISAADADLQNWQAQMASVQRQMLQLGSLAPASLAGDGYAPAMPVALEPVTSYVPVWMLPAPTIVTYSTPLATVPTPS
ncbi:hypothetical protein [Burkholderia glumae]|uniref:Uncharacterized protein n=1 Tax=Burkholderia glumae TaxID=337 RepID=A0AAP9XWK7_BURGL|nr:hypothetical protein [Burkholderia glumae]ACR31506.1 Hypothetical protein bglu_2g11120 [Burkholderia glumae BGR1]AJY64049.1 hypothetical protein KS03_4808 [Burkholderia glumae LMG 2196 = ATCC 33617]KHJ61179.1 hypothetical protein NCPPB3923_20145 [Burkholderia glumae]MCM2485333.1 hypothetical protein [Burkholderia glumae]MCM2495686.1 hypothetical protein [Burkholderia glumae]